MNQDSQLHAIILVYSLGPDQYFCLQMSKYGKDSLKLGKSFKLASLLRSNMAPISEITQTRSGMTFKPLSNDIIVLHIL